MSSLRLTALACISAALIGRTVLAAAPFPWSDPALSPDVRAELAVAQMTFDEKISLVHGRYPARMNPRPDDVVPSAGYVPGVARLGIPALRETDASLGVAQARRQSDDATALPSSLALAATWNPVIAAESGAMIGKQTRQKGFNTLLAGGVNLSRDPFNGRNFEYLGEDPLLAGIMAGASVKGIQRQHVVATVKHFALNAQETGRYVLDAQIDEAAFRESDLLAFQIAIEQGNPGSVLCAYNRVNGPFACESPQLLTKTLRDDWGFRGWVMSDWGAVHSVGAANAGLDQQSGQEADTQAFFDAPLREAIARGEVSTARLDQMVQRILRGMFANGLMDDVPAPGPLNTAADNAVAQSTAEAGIVMLKNAGVLPLKGTIRRIAVIGGHADRGVLSGGGSSQVVPLGSWRPTPSGESPSAFRLPYYHPSAPVASLRARVPDAQVTFFAGNDVAAAVAAAKDADVAVVFAEQWTGETRDAEFRLSDDQEQLIRAVAKANRVTVVVLETGGQVLMPWIATVPAVVAAWYPGGRGGEAIARLLFGDFNPTGRLPVTVPASASQLPRGQPGGLGIAIDRVAPSSAANDPSFPVAYIEGSSVGYRWFAERQEKALFPFGFGLSYTRYRYSNPRVVGGDMLKVSVTVKNSGARAGTETAQAYLLKAPGRSQRRLLGWTQVHLEPGETRTVDISVEPRLLSNWDQAAHSWRIDAGRYEIFVGSHAEDSTLRAHADLRGRALKP